MKRLMFCVHIGLGITNIVIGVVVIIRDQNIPCGLFSTALGGTIMAIGIDNLRRM